MFKLKSLALTIAFSLITAIPGLSLSMKFAGKPRVSSEIESPVIGQIAPNFRLIDFNGRPLELVSLRDKVVIIDFWASWCGPCCVSMPRLERLHREFKDQGVVILAINIEEIQDARAFLKENSFTFKMLSDPDAQVAETYDVTAIPTMFVIGRDGRIIARYIGIQTEEGLRADLRKAGIHSINP